MIHATKGWNMTLPRTLNHSTGKISNHQTGFNDITWGETMRKYVRSILKAYKKKPEKFVKIITCAKEFSRKSCHANNGTGGADGNAIEEDNNLDKELIDISSSKEDNLDWSGLSLSGTLMYSFMNSCLFAQACLILAQDAQLYLPITPTCFSYCHHGILYLAWFNSGFFAWSSYCTFHLVLVILSCFFFVSATTWMDIFLIALSLGFLLRHLRSSLISLEHLPWGSLPYTDLLILFRKWTGLI